MKAIRDPKSVARAEGKDSGSAGRVRVSVCASTSFADVAACVAGGADAVGVLVGVTHRAEDAVPVEVGRQLLLATPPYVSRYAVTHATTVDALAAVVDALPIDVLQAHDAASPGAVARIRARYPGLRILKAVHIHPGETPDWESYIEIVDGFVLDSVDRDGDRIGGTGRTHDWSRSASIAAASPLPVVLAGGLTPTNTEEAVRVVAPWALNVNSGVEVDGHKDTQRVRDLVEAANRCSGSTNG